jgi:NAD(P)-dependent dehydrogenase (short-subunit alcohol dehydrogenase family)
VAVLGTTAKDLDDTRDEILRRGGNAMVLPADISQSEQLRTAVDALIQQWGRLDIVHANAGINGVWAPLEQIGDDEWDRTINVNLKGTFLTLKHCVPFLKQQSGSVIVTASVNGTRMFSNTGATAYACSKAAEVALTKMLALELAKHHIRVNVICPGFIDSKIHEETERRDLKSERVPVEFPAGVVPLTNGGPGTPEQVAQMVLLFASDASDHVTGTEIYIDGGQSLLQG